MILLFFDEGSGAPVIADPNRIEFDLPATVLCEFDLPATIRYEADLEATIIVER